MDYLEGTKESQHGTDSEEEESKILTSEEVKLPPIPRASRHFINTAVHVTFNGKLH